MLVSDAAAVLPPDIAVIEVRESVEPDWQAIAARYRRA